MLEFTVMTTISSHHNISYWLLALLRCCKFHMLANIQFWQVKPNMRRCDCRYYIYLSTAKLVSQANLGQQFYLNIRNRWHGYGKRASVSLNRHTSTRPPVAHNWLPISRNVVLTQQFSFHCTRRTQYVDEPAKWASTQMMTWRNSWEN